MQRLIVKNISIVGIIFLFIFSSVTPISFGSNIDSTEQSTDDIDLLQDYYGCYSLEEIPESIRSIISENEVLDIPEIENVINVKDSPEPLNDPMDSPWPMYCHDTRHTGRSPYITTGNPGSEKWRFDTIDETSGSLVIDSDGIIYIGASHLFAVYPNGTMKWKFETGGIFTSAPAIDDENDVLYIGTIWSMPNYLLAINTSNKAQKWKFKTDNHIWSSPAIDNDGSIYFGCEDKRIYALYPNGTLKWEYVTGYVVLSSPAIGDDGTIYCGSHDTYLYALYPNNGTLKWRYKTGNWIRTSPCIGDDGTIYAVSIDGPLHALNPDGTLKWKTNVGAGTSPTIGQDGTIYCGYKRLYAVNPVNGSVKWTYDPGEDRLIRGATPCNSFDGTIYFGTEIGEYDGGELIAVNPDGSERWRIMLATDWIMSAPTIDENGTIYVGSWNDGYHPGSWGYLHAIGELDSNAPSTPLINGPTTGKPDVTYNFTFEAISPIGNNVYYWIEWGDNKGTGWLGPFPSGQKITKSHDWSMEGTFTIKARAKDIENLWGPWGELEVNMPRDKAVSSSLFLGFLEQFPILKEVLLRLINPVR